MNISKFDLYDKIKSELFQDVAVSLLLNGYFTWTQTKRLEKKTKWELHKNAASYLEKKSWKPCSII